MATRMSWKPFYMDSLVFVSKSCYASPIKTDSGAYNLIQNSSAQLNEQMIEISEWLKEDTFENI